MRTTWENELHCDFQGVKEYYVDNLGIKNILLVKATLIEKSPTTTWACVNAC